MKTRIFALTAIAVTLAACSSTPDRNSALDQARSRYDAAQADRQVAMLASNELKKAGESVVVAEKAWTEGGERADIDHLAYMANQRVTVAQETAANLAAQAVTASAEAERNKLRLAVRTNEADRAQQQLALAEQSNARKTTALAVADANAERDQARMDSLETQLKALDAKKTERGMVLTLGDVLFESGQDRLLPASTDNMIKLADFFKNNPQSAASIEGHTDSVGSSSSNMDLSQRRASAVMTALVNRGASASQLSTRALGEGTPVGDNAKASGRQMNRRVEIVFSANAENALRQ